MGAVSDLTTVVYPPTPESRTLYILKQDRTLVIAKQSRTLDIAKQDRTLYIFN
jgi:hypothetical protein